MITIPQADHPQLRFELRFESLFNAVPGLAVPCDEAGHVDLDALSERRRNEYFYARAMLGRQFASPQVRRCAVV